MRYSFFTSAVLVLLTGILVPLFIMTLPVYITSSDDFAFEAYGVHAVRYLLKPVLEELFIEAPDTHTSQSFEIDRLSNCCLADFV